CYLDAPTYLFERGNESRPRKDDPLTPGVPQFLDFAELQITPVALPESVYAVGLQPEVVQLYLDAAERERAAAESALALAQAQLTKIDPADAKRLELHAQSVESAEKSLRAAELKRCSIEARAAADAVNLRAVPAENAQELAQIAALKEREYALA